MTSRRILHQLALTCLLLIQSAGAVFAEPGELPRIPRLVSEKITVSGLSSGAAMAVQMGVAYSSRIAGVGIVAGPPYLCAEGSVIRAYNTCLLLGREQLSKWMPFPSGPTACEAKAGVTIDVKDLIDDTQALARDRHIDPVAGIGAQRVWEFRGRCDGVVGSNASVAQAEFYRHFGAAFVSRTQDAVHTMPTDKPGQGACNTEDKDYVSSCDFDAVGDMLRHIAPTQGATRSAVKGQWHRFEQARYIDGSQDAAKRLTAISMAREAEVFVPDLCSQQACKVHVALHGCLQGIDEAVYRNFVRESGYAEWASSLGLVVVFPRVTALRAFERSFDAIGNPAGCWDWWGYTNRGLGSFRQYATREAPQMKAIMKMVGALTAN